MKSAHPLTLMTELKSDICQNIKLWIDDDEKNAVKLWIYSVLSSLRMTKHIRDSVALIASSNMADYVRGRADFVEASKEEK